MRELADLAVFLAEWLIGVGLVVFIFLAVRRIVRMRADHDGPVNAPVCEKCGYDLRASVGRRCPECGTFQVDRRRYLRALSNEWPANPLTVRAPGPEETPVLLVSARDQMEASLLRQQLEARGIAVIEEESTLSGTLPHFERPVFRHVKVYSGDEALAREYLRRAQGWPDDANDAAD